ncbi:MAG: TerC family protein [Planctomycetes bacterium]|nr:TerC family protein [Planctomycetota bacterium]
MSVPIHWWIFLNLFIVAMLALDLGVFQRRAHAVSVREAAVWSGVWVFLSLSFNLLLYWMWPEELSGTSRGQAAMDFFTGYVIEKALSVDNIFVFVLIFRYFKVAPRYQHRVLFWGVLGAMVMRAVFIAAGVTLIEKFEFVIYILGAFLVLTGIKMALSAETEVHPERNFVLKLVRRFVPVTEDYVEGRFFTRVNGRRFATPLFIVLVFVETTDVVFAVDSIPAILAITTDSFLVYSSNIFAILGLRAMYFLLVGVVDRFHYLSYGLALILVFVGTKMLLDAGLDYHISTGASLATVGVILATSVVVSLLSRPVER